MGQNHSSSVKTSDDIHVILILKEVIALCNQKKIRSITLLNELRLQIQQSGLMITFTNNKFICYNCNKEDIDIIIRHYDVKNGQFIQYQKN